MARLSLTPRGQFKPPGIPRINWRHPLAKGIRLYLFDTGTGSVLDLVSGRTSSTQGTLPASKPSPWGQGILWNGSPSLYWSADAQLRTPTGTGTFTWATGIVETVSPASNARPFGRTAAAGSSQPGSNWEFVVDGGSAWTFFNSSGSQTQGTQWAGATTQTYMTLGGIAHSGTSVDTYGNGVLIGTTTGVTIQDYDTNDQVIISGGAAAPSFQPFTGYVFWGAFWARALSPSEMLALHEQPYDFLEWPWDRIPALGLLSIPPLVWGFDLDTAVRPARKPWHEQQLADQWISPYQMAQTTGPLGWQAPESFPARDRRTRRPSPADDLGPLSTNLTTQDFGFEPLPTFAARRGKTAPVLADEFWPIQLVPPTPTAFGIEAPLVFARSRPRFAPPIPDEFWPSQRIPPTPTAFGWESPMGFPSRKLGPRPSIDYLPAVPAAIIWEFDLEPEAALRRSQWRPLGQDYTPGPPPLTVWGWADSPQFPIRRPRSGNLSDYDPLAPSSTLWGYADSAQFPIRSRRISEWSDYAPSAPSPFVWGYDDLPTFPRRTRFVPCTAIEDVLAEIIYASVPPELAWETLNAAPIWLRKRLLDPDDYLVFIPGSTPTPITDGLDEGQAAPRQRIASRAWLATLEETFRPFPTAITPVTDGLDEPGYPPRSRVASRSWLSVGEEFNFVPGPPPPRYRVIFGQIIGIGKLLNKP